MPRQKGVPFVGSIGELSFYYDKQHGYLIRTKGGPSKTQIKKKKSMEAVRQNNSEFGRSSSYGALLRRAFRPLVLPCREYTMSRRLQSLLLSIMKLDNSRPPGERALLKERLVALQEFELNAHLSYKIFFKKGADIEIHQDRIAVKGGCRIPAMVAKRANYYKVVSVAAAVNFQKKKFVNAVKESEMLPCKGSRAFEFEHGLNTTGYLFYGLVVCFYQKQEKAFKLVTDNEMKAGFISFIG